MCTLCVVILLTYPDDVAILPMELFKLKILLVSSKRHSSEVKIGQARQEWSREPIQAVETDPVDNHAEINAGYHTPDEVA